MSDENENERIINAKYRITKFTLDNEHLKRMIEELKKEISTVEATRAKLLSEFEESDPRQVVSDPVLTQHSSLSGLSDSSSSSVNSDFLGDTSLNNSDFNEADSFSFSTEDLEDSSTEDREQTASSVLETENVASNILMLDCVNCVESLLSNLNVIKKSLRTDLCENCAGLRNEINTLQKMEVVLPETSVNRDKKDTSVPNRRSYEQNSNTVTSVSSGLSYLYHIFNFMSNPFLFVFICGYIGMLIYIKQANSYIVVTPPQ